MSTKDEDASQRNAAECVTAGASYMTDGLENRTDNESRHKAVVMKVAGSVCVRIMGTKWRGLGAVPNVLVVLEEDGLRSE